MVVLEGSSYDKEDLNGGETSHTNILLSLLLESATKTDDESLKPLYLMEPLCGENIISNTLLHKESQQKTHPTLRRSLLIIVPRPMTILLRPLQTLLFWHFKIDSGIPSHGQPTGVLIPTQSNKAAVKRKQTQPCTIQRI